MIGKNLISTGVLPVIAYSSSGNGGGDIDDIILEDFTYDGINNTFNLNNIAQKVLMVFIENGTFPSLIPVGVVNSVTIPSNLIFNGTKVYVQYVAQ